MKKLIVFTLLAFVGFVSTYIQTAISAPQPAVPTAPIKMDYTTNPAKVVMFSHQDHKDLQCVECHHPVKRDGGQVSYKKCSSSGCHDIKGRSQEPLSYYQVMHNKNPSEGYSTCMSCHTENAKTASKEKKKALVACVGSGCHAK
ncbi:MAG: cytochrome c3 family protein [Desulfovibrionaceae bacterium]|nr:cytochrome c3 family protein [Desulfovibrionaceae bacterium]